LMTERHYDENRALGNNGMKGGWRRLKATVSGKNGSPSDLHEWASRDRRKCARL
jgi:hypothetical protein